MSKRKTLLQKLAYIVEDEALKALKRSLKPKKPEAESRFKDNLTF